MKIKFKDIFLIILKLIKIKILKVKNKILNLKLQKFFIIRF